MEIMNDASTMEKMMLTKAVQRQMPATGTLELTPLCNMNCRMCYVRLSKEEMDKRGKMKTAEEWIALAEEMKDAGVLFLLLTGGEPLTFPGFKELYRYLKKIGMVLTINTNGTLINEEWADFFEKYPPRRINITLYGINERTYSELCRYKGYEKTIRGIKLLKSRHIDVKLNGSATKENFSEISEWYKIAKELDVPLHVDTYMIPGLHDRKLSIEEQSRLQPELMAQAEIEMMKQEMLPERFKQSAEYMLSKVEEEGTYPAGVSCLAGNCAFQIDWLGNMRPCLSMTDVMVPVFETGFKEGWRQISAQAKTYRLNDKCISCKMRPVCKTCPANAFLETGDYSGLPTYLCGYSKAMIELLKKELGK